MPEMSKHFEAYEALKTIAEYCIGRDCRAECIFCKGSINKGGSCCCLVSYKFSPAGFLLDPDEIKPVKERCEKLERQEKP